MAGALDGVDVLDSCLVTTMRLDGLSLDRGPPGETHRMAPPPSSHSPVRGRRKGRREGKREGRRKGRTHSLSVTATLRPTQSTQRRRGTGPFWVLHSSVLGARRPLAFSSSSSPSSSPSSSSYSFGNEFQTPFFFCSIPQFQIWFINKFISVGFWDYLGSKRSDPLNWPWN